MKYDFKLHRRIRLSIAKWPSSDDIWFFSQNSARSHLLRTLTLYEMMCANTDRFELSNLGQNIHWVTLVRKIQTGVHLELICQMNASIDSDAPEDVCDYLFTAISGPALAELGDEIEAAVKTAKLKQVQNGGH